MKLNLAEGVRKNLAGIAALIESGTLLNQGFKGLEWMVKLNSGQICFQSDLDLDTDGKRDPAIRYESTEQPQTSLDPGGKILSSNETPFFVLPGHFGSNYGIRLGDIAVVLYRDKMEYALFADVGPRNKIGEGSIALHRSLGFERVVNGKIKDVGIDSGVVTLVFPGSGNGKIQSADSVRALGRSLFKGLGGLDSAR